jgi:hypothetical protein
MDVSLVTNTENQNDQRLRPISLARLCASLALLSTAVTPAPSFSQETIAQRMACTSDALRLCSAFIPDADAITACLKEKSAELGDACRTAFEGAMNQLPGARDDVASRKRPGR